MNGPCWTRIAPLLALLTLITGCRDLPVAPPDEPSSESIELTPPEVTVTLGGSVTMQAVYRDRQGTAQPSQQISWSSSDTTRAVVDQAGVVRTIYPGTVTIAASAGSVRATATVKVQTANTSLRLQPGNPSIIAGTEFRLFANAPGWGAQTREWRPGEIRWTSSSPAIAQVDSMGVVSGVSRGAATITAEAEGLAAAATVSVLPAVQLVQISAGASHTCALTSTGEPFCWGQADYAAVGAKTAPEYCNQYGCKLGLALSPLKVETNTPFASVSAAVGSYYFADSCGVSTGGRGLCWGASFFRDQLGSVASTSQCTGGGSALTPCSFEPLAVDLASVLLSIGVGNGYSCALTQSGAIYCWGSNFRRRAGQTTTEYSTSPQPVAVDRSFTALSVGDTHNCALDADGGAYCWGDNQSGQLGIAADTAGHPAPVHARADLRFSAIGAGPGYTCGVTRAGEAHCWGTDRDGILSGASEARSLGLVFRSLSVGGGEACGVTASEEAYCWGDNRLGQLGIGAVSGTVTSPTLVAGGLHWRSLSVGGSSSCGIATDGIAYCWGSNLYGQLGIGSTESTRAAPTRVAGQG